MISLRLLASLDSSNACLYKTVPYKTVQYKTVRKSMKMNEKTIRYKTVLKPVPINNCFDKLAGLKPDCFVLDCFFPSLNDFSEYFVFD